MRRLVVDSVGLNSFLQIVTSLIIRGEPPITMSQEARHIFLPYSRDLPERLIMLIFLLQKFVNAFPIANLSQFESDKCACR